MILKKKFKEANKVFLASDRTGKELFHGILAHILDLNENDTNRVVFQRDYQRCIKNAFKEFLIHQYGWFIYEARRVWTV